MTEPHTPELEGMEFRRSLDVDRKGVDLEARTVQLSFSSELPVERFFGFEVLDHSTKSVNLERLNNGAPVLIDHFSDQVGVVEKAWIDTKAKKGRALLRFSKSALGETVFQDIADGIRRNVSVGYRVHKIALQEEKDGVSTYVSRNWEPMELSIVSVPADATVGVGRDRPRFVEDVNAPAWGIPTTFVPNAGRRPEETPEIVNINQKEGVMPENKETVAGIVAPPVVNVDHERNEAVKIEQARVRELLALGDQHKCPEEARKAVMEGGTVEDLKRAILERYQAVKPIEPGPVEIGMTKQERQSFSFVRMITALQAKDWGLAPFEHECSRAVAKQLGREPQGMFVPDDVLYAPMAEGIDSRSQMEMVLRGIERLLQTRELDVATAGAAGNLVGTQLLSASFIELLRNFEVLQAVGAQVLSGLVGDVTFPRQITGAVGGWVAESGNVANSELTTNLPALTPHSMGAYSDMTRKLLLQSTPSIEALVRADLAMALALEKDAAGLNGTGAGDIPLGIRLTSGIGDVDHGANGLAETWATIVEYESDVSVANAAVGNMWYIMTPAAFGSAKTIEKASGTAVFLGSGRIAPIGTGEVNGYPVAVTNQLPSNGTKGSGTSLSATVFGNFRDLIIGEWSGVDMLVDPYTLGLDGGLRVVVHQDVDYLIRHVGSFSASDDVVTT